jgi:hypothetical protein
MKRFSLFAALALLLGVAAPRAQAQVCVGDCDGNNQVTVDEIITMVNLALTGGVTGCTAGDSNADGSITVDEIVTAVNNALLGCGTPGPTPTPTMTGGTATCGNGATETGEDCDDGGQCIGGSDSGTACTSETACAGNIGACVGGTNNLNSCDVTVEGACPAGDCVKCRPTGGDGCAQNCTAETDLPFPLKQGVINGVEIEDGSGATVYGPFLTVPLAFPGGGVDVSGFILTVGKSRDGGPIPAVIKAENVALPRIPVQTIACACLRGVTAQTCGGTIYDVNGARSTNCTPGFEGQETCPVDLPCMPVHGAGNTASGFVNCAGDAIEYNVDLVQDCNGTPGEPPFDPSLTFTEGGTSASGSAAMLINGAIGTVVGMCTGTAADYGPDGTFCTDDDDPGSFGTPNPISLTTGSVTGLVLNPADFEGDTNGPWSVSGQRFTCNGGQLTSAAGANLAGVFTACDQPTISDIVVPNNFETP